METICLECGAAVLQTAGGRPRLNCSNGCRRAAHRRRHSVDRLFPAGDLEAVGRGHGMLLPPAPTEGQVAGAILEARAISGAFCASVRGLPPAALALRGRRHSLH